MVLEVCIQYENDLNLPYAIASFSSLPNYHMVSPAIISNITIIVFLEIIVEKVKH